MDYDINIPKVVIDNGSGFIKAGVAGKNRPPVVYPNCIGQQRKRGYLHVGEHCYACSEYFCLRPQQCGIVVDPMRQLLIWDRVIGKNSNSSGLSPEKIGLILTGPLLTPPGSLRVLSEVLFEELRVPVAAFIPSQTASYHSQFSKSLKTESFPQNNHVSDKKDGDNDKSTALIVDFGFSSTHVVPYADGLPLVNCALRSNIGGTHLNAYLKNVMALRSLDLNFNELLVQHIKEEACYVSPNIDEECKLATRLKGRGLAHEYILPEFVKNKTQMSKFFQNHRSNPKSLLDHSQDYLLNKEACVDEHVHFTFPSSSNAEAQKIRLFSECFAVPEALFTPKIIDLNEVGVVDLICKSMSKCPVEVQSLLARNIIICGGGAKIKGLKLRLYNELKASFPDHWAVTINHSTDPQLSAFYGACSWALNNVLFNANAVSRTAFLETGVSIG